jgi:hypothetical protein
MFFSEGLTLYFGEASSGETRLLLQRLSVEYLNLLAISISIQCVADIVKPTESQSTALALTKSKPAKSLQR